MALGARSCLAVTAAACAALAACGGADDGAAPTTAIITATTTTGPTSVAPTAAPTSAPVTSAATTIASTAAPTTEPATTAPTTTVPALSYDFSAVGPIVEAFVAERGLDGAGLVIVERDGGVVHEQYWGEFSADRVSLVASSSKMVAAGVLLRLRDDGLLDIDAPIAEAVDWGAGNPDVTVAQLLSNSSGLVGLLPNPAYQPYVCQFLPTGDLEDCGATIVSTADDDADLVAPDTAFRYGGAQWQVAGAVAESVSGRTWAELIDEIYAQPCGIETLGFNNHFTQFGSIGFVYPDEFEGDPANLAPTANPNIEGGMYITPGDYARLLLMHLRGGRCDGGQVLSQQALDLMHADRIGEVYGGDALPGTGYGMGWWVDRATGRLTDPGAYGSVPWLDLADGYGGFLVVEADTATGGALAGLLYDVVDDAVLAARG